MRAKCGKILRSCLTVETARSKSRFCIKQLHYFHAFTAWLFAHKRPSHEICVGQGYVVHTKLLTHILMRTTPPWLRLLNAENVYLRTNAPYASITTVGPISTNANTALLCWCVCALTDRRSCQLKQWSGFGTKQMLKNVQRLFVLWFYNFSKRR
jgi:hypothetical protein